AIYISHKPPSPEAVPELSVGVIDRRHYLSHVNFDLIPEDEPLGGGLVQEPLQRALRQWIARVPAADVRVSANEPTLLHLVDRPVRSACLTSPDRLRPECRLESSAMFVQCERMEGVLVVETQMRIEEAVLVDLGPDAPDGQPKRANSVPDADEPDPRRSGVFHQPLFLDGRILGQTVRHQRSDRRGVVEAIPRIELL